MGILPEDVSQNLLVRLPVAALRRYQQAGYWTDETIYGIAREHARRSPSRTAVRDSYCTLTYAELFALADATAADLAAAGLRPGDRVAAWMSSRVDMAVFLLACSRNGYVLCPSLHRNHTVEEVADLLDRMQAKAFAGETGYGADGDERDIFAIADKAGADKAAQVEKIYRLPLPEKRTAAQIGYLAKAGQAGPDAPAGQANDVVYLAFTSGTTGSPKGVMHSNNTLLANARSLAGDWAFGQDSVIYTLSPLSHNLGFGALVLTLLVGGEIVLHDLPRGQRLLERLEATGTTFMFGVPAHALDLLTELEKAGGAKLDKLKGFRISGAAVSAPVVEALLSYGITPQSGYGMTEAGSHHYTLPDDAPDLIAHTSGRACPGYEVRIFSPDDPDAPLPVGEVGHIGGRGASLMLGYFDNQKATESSFNKSGWFMTGDLGCLDERGYLRITGRIKEIIIRGGHNIHPAKIEILAMRHPDVERAAALPVKDERLGEKVCIVVMPKNGGAIDPESLLNHLHSQGLSKYDMPEYFLQVDEIPLSPSGKILKRALVPGMENGKYTPQPVRWRG